MSRNTGTWLCNFVSLISLLVPVLCQAAGTCYQWDFGTNNWNDSPQESASEFEAYCNASPQNENGCDARFGGCNIYTHYRTCSYAVTAIPVGAWPDYSFSIRATGPEVKNEQGLVVVVAKDETKVFTMGERANPQGCPQCPDVGVERTLDGASGSAPSVTCSNGCQYSRSGPYINFSQSASGLSGYIGTYKSSGVACTQTADTGLNKSSENDCKATSTDLYCMVKNQSGENCGQVNGEWFCAKSTQPGACSSTASGGKVCGANRSDGKTETPPGPDTGTAGEPATPTASVKDDSTGRVTNYYNSTTVNGSTGSSSSSGGGSSSSSGSGGSSSSSSGGSSSSSSSGDGTASGGETCEAAPVCTGDAIQCALLNQEWRGRCSFSAYTKEELGAPADGTDGSALTNETQDVSTLFSGITGAGGACPADIPIDLGDWGTFTLGLEEFCWVFESIGYAVLISAWLSAVMIVIGHSKGQS